MLNNLLSDGLIGILSGANKLAKTFIGDKAAKEANFHAEQMEIQRGYQSEFLAPEKKGWFNQLIDGYNRLMRPAMTSGIIYLFIWACVDPVEFTLTVQALQIIPDMMWYVLLAIISFWFGGRILEKAPMKITANEIAKSKEISKKIKEERTNLSNDKYIQVDIDAPKQSTNKIVTEWKKTKSNISIKPLSTLEKIDDENEEELRKDER